MKEIKSKQFNDLAKNSKNTLSWFSNVEIHLSIFFFNPGRYILLEFLANRKSNILLRSLG